MIINKIDSQTGTGYLIARANLSAGLRENAIVVLILLFFMLVAALPWIVTGLWVTGIFVMIDLCMLVLALYVTVQSCRMKDVIRLDEQQVTVEQGRDFPERCWTYQREWTRLCYRHTRPRAALPQVSLVSSGDSVRIAARITYKDLRRLVGILRKYLPYNEELIGYRPKKGSRP